MRAAGDAGLLVLMAGPDVVRLAPSLVISLDEILEGLGRLETAVNRALT
jgi:acetylornithine/N-succinyldiaminopimelate aminotransferase